MSDDRGTLDTDVVDKVSLKATEERWKLAFRYISERPELEDIVISGGDSYQLKARQVTLIGERNLFDSFDYLVSNWALPLGALGVALFTGWALLWWAVMPASVFGATLLSMLELFVAFLQAYIFTFLSALFIGQAVHPH